MHIPYAHMCTAHTHTYTTQTHTPCFLACLLVLEHPVPGSLGEGAQTLLGPAPPALLPGFPPPVAALAGRWGWGRPSWHKPERSVLDVDSFCSNSSFQLLWRRGMSRGRLGRGGVLLTSFLCPGPPNIPWSQAGLSRRSRYLGEHWQESSPEKQPGVLSLREELFISGRLGLLSA